MPAVHGMHRQHAGGRSARWLIILIVWALPVVVHAAPASGFGHDRVELNVGTFLADFDTSMRIALPGRPPPGIDLERDLGLQATDHVLRVDGYVRLGSRHRLLLTYYDFRRSARVVLDRQVHWQGLSLARGAGIRGETELQVTPVRYAYSFYKDADLEVAVSLGVYWMRVSARVATIGLEGGARQASSAVEGPLPVVGLSLDYAPAHRWVCGGSGQYDRLDSGRYQGHFEDLRVYAEYLVLPGAGLGLGYDYVSLVVYRPAWSLEAQYQYRGLQAYATFRF